MASRGWRKTVSPGNALDPDVNRTLLERAELLDKTFREAGLYRTYTGGDLMDRIEELKTMAIQFPDDPDIFDVGLGRIYDWADANRVWIEPA